LNPTLKIGLIVDDVRVSRYVQQIVIWASQAPGVAITHLIVQRDIGSRRSGAARFRALSPNRILRSLLWAFMERVESMMIRRHPVLADADRLHDIGSLVPGRIAVHPQVSRSGNVHRFTETDLDRIRGEKFDLLLRAGSGILRGGILQCARLGILSFHHGDNRVNRGGPPGFWEVLNREPSTGFTLQVLTEELDGGRVVARGNFPTQGYFLLNQKLLQERANVHVKSVLRRLAEGGNLDTGEEAFPYSEPLYRQPGVWELLQYGGLQLSSRLLARIQRLMGVRDWWHVAFLPVPWREAALWRGRTIPNPPGGFLADPFVAQEAGRTFCFVEEYSFARGKGVISAYALDGESSRRIGVVLEEPFHLSFPYLFSFNGSWYMCPEAGESGQVRIYRCTDFPSRWELVATPMTGITAADGMIFAHEDRWWMLVNLDLSGVGDRCSELYLYSAPSPLATNWVPHPCNPLVVDSRRARNGGLILEGKRIFRVAQVHGGSNGYGRAARIYEIVQLDLEHYEEKFVGRLEPGFHSDVLGMHQLHSAAGYTVWDFRTRGRSG
jgi:hypothetical protein